MICPSCQRPCVVTLTSSVTIGRRRITWTECANCYRQDDKSTLSPNKSTLPLVTGQSTVSPRVREAKPWPVKAPNVSGDLFSSVSSDGATE